MHQSTEQSINNRSPDLPSLHLHEHIRAESGLRGIKTKLAQSLIPGNVSQPREAPQILGSGPVVTSVGTPSPKGLGVHIIKEEVTFLQKDPKHRLELSREQRATGLPEEKTQQPTGQVSDVELTPRRPYQVTGGRQVTPLALSKAVDSMGIIPESLRTDRTSGFVPTATK